MCLELHRIASRVGYYPCSHPIIPVFCQEACRVFNLGMEGELRRRSAANYQSNTNHPQLRRSWVYMILSESCFVWRVIPFGCPQLLR